jgi:hypothetical protein
MMTRALNNSSLFSYAHDTHFNEEGILQSLHYYLNISVILYYICKKKFGNGFIASYIFQSFLDIMSAHYNEGFYEFYKI